MDLIIVIISYLDDLLILILILKEPVLSTREETAQVLEHLQLVPAGTRSRTGDSDLVLSSTESGSSVFLNVALIAFRTWQVAVCVPDSPSHGATVRKRLRRHVRADRCQMLTSGPRRVYGTELIEPGTRRRRVGVHASKRATRKARRMETGLLSPPEHLAELSRPRGCAGASTHTHPS